VVVSAKDGTVLGIDPGDGTVRWKTSTGISTSLPPVLDGEQVLVAGSGLVSLEALTGRLLWTAPEEAAVIAPPTVASGLIFTVEDKGVIRCRERSTGKTRWTFPAKDGIDAGLASDPDLRVFAGTTAHSVIAVRVSRKKRDWRWKVGADVLYPPTVYDKSVLVASHDAVLYALNRHTGQLNWRAPLPSQPISGPLLAGRAVLVACLDREVPGYDAATGRKLGVLLTPSPMAGAPVVLGDRLFVALLDRKVKVLGYSLNLTPFAPGASPPPKKPPAP